MQRLFVTQNCASFIPKSLITSQQSISANREARPVIGLELLADVGIDQTERIYSFSIRHRQISDTADSRGQPFFPIVVVLLC